MNADLNLPWPPYMAGGGSRLGPPGYILPLFIKLSIALSISTEYQLSLRLFHLNVVPSNCVWNAFDSSRWDVELAPGKRSAYAFVV